VAVLPAAGETGEPWLGIVVGEPADGGIRIVAVVPGGPAFRAELRIGDVLMEIGQRPVPDRASLQEAMAALRPGTPVALRIRRGGDLLEQTVLPLDRSRRSARLLESLGSAYVPSEPPPSPSPFPVHGLITVGMPPELRTHYGAPADAGILVVRVEDGSSASRAGIRVGDVLLQAGDRVLEVPEDLFRGPFSGKVDLKLVREREPILVTLSLRDRMVRVLPVPGDPEGDRIRALERQIEELQERIRELEDQLRRAGKEGRAP
jgi:serine protease Do